MKTTNTKQVHLDTSRNKKTAMFAGGCFWCVEADFQKVLGVSEVVSGYSGGDLENPTYENYAKGGHREVVEVTYDPLAVGFEDLVLYLIKHTNPTDADGSFYDRGKQYTPAIYYNTEEERVSAESVVKDINERKIYKDELTIPILPRTRFWIAEEYHQDYADRSTLKYKYYRLGSGRDSFIKQHWGDNTEVEFREDDEFDKSRWEAFHKPDYDELKRTLSALQFKVTQKDGTEPSFKNEYDTNQ